MSKILSSINVVFIENGIYLNGICAFLEDAILMKYEDERIMSKMIRIDNYTNFTTEMTSSGRLLNKIHIVNVYDNNIKQFAVGFGAKKSAEEFSQLVFGYAYDDKKYLKALNYLESDSVMDRLKAKKIFADLAFLNWRDSQQKSEQASKKAFELGINKTKTGAKKAFEALVNNDGNSPTKSTPDTVEDFQEFNYSSNHFQNSTEQTQAKKTTQPAFNFIDNNHVDSTPLTAFREESSKNKFSSPVSNDTASDENSSKIYDMAFDLSQNSDLYSLKEAAALFSSILNYKDSNEFYKSCTEKINIILQEEKNKLKDEESKGIKLLAQSDEESVLKALNIFKKLNENNFETAAYYISLCESKLKSIPIYQNLISRVKENLEYDENKYLLNNIPMFVGLLVNNPYYILGISCCDSEDAIYKASEGIKKYIKIGLIEKYSPKLYLNNFKKPDRSEGTVNKANHIAVGSFEEKIEYQWLWFKSDLYCDCWDYDEIFDLLQLQGNEFDYDLFLACYYNLIIKDMWLNNENRWEMFLNYFSKILKKVEENNQNICLSIFDHIQFDSTSNNSEKTAQEFIIKSFKDTILKPFHSLCEIEYIYSLERIISLFKKLNSKYLFELSIDTITSTLKSMIEERTNTLNEIPPELLDADKLLNVVIFPSDKADLTEIFSLIRETLNLIGNGSIAGLTFKNNFSYLLENLFDKASNIGAAFELDIIFKDLFALSTPDFRTQLINNLVIDWLSKIEDEINTTEMKLLAERYLREGYTEKYNFWINKYNKEIS